MARDGSHGPKPWTKHKTSTLFLRVPAYDWPYVRRGNKREFRAASGLASTAFNVETPTAVVAYTVNHRGVYHRQMMVLQAVWQEPLGAISPESLAAEGYDSIAEFRRYWIAREHKRFTPTRLVFVYRVRPFTEADIAGMGEALLRRLYREHLDEAD